MDTASSGGELQQFSGVEGESPHPGACHTLNRSDWRLEYGRHNTGKTSDPVSRFKKFQALFLQRARFGFEIVNPSSQRRKTHQYGLGAAARFKSEDGAPVIKKVEFHVTA